MKVKSNAINDFSDATRVSTKEIKFSNYGRDNLEGNSKSKDKEKKKDYSKERKQKRGE